MNGSLLPKLFGRDVRRLHCVGVGGMGVGPLAIYLAELGFSVSGEDDALGDEMRVQLERAGVRLGLMGEDCQLLVCSSAIPQGHPALQRAFARTIPAARRGEVLAEAVKGRKFVAVCGAHGKTTTTAMLITLLREAGLPAGYVLGGLFNDPALPPASAGKSEWVVGEVDESDGTISCFSPELTVATNLDWDHPDFYRTPEDLERTFAALFSRTRLAVVAGSACARATALARESGRGTVVGGEGADFVFRSEPGRSGRGLVLKLSGRYTLSEASVHAYGAFNASNAAMAFAAGQLMGVALRPLLLDSYVAVRRRQCELHSEPGLRVIEDYAHHPSEIRSLLESMREAAGTGRLVVAFQPHRYSRTLQFRADFAKALSLADEVHLLEVYPAGESPIPGASARDLLELFPEALRPSAFYHGEDSDACFASLQKNLRPGDLVVIVGAGDIDRKARHWLSARRWDRWSAKLAGELPAGAILAREEPLAPKTTLRVGGAARVYAEPAGVEELRCLLAAAKRDGVDWFLLGRGSNLIVPDEGVEGLVISLSQPFWSAFEERGHGRLWAGAGLRLKNLCGLAASRGLGGLEFLEGIPGSIGGALRMNAGAMGHWLYEWVEEVQVLSTSGAVVSLKGDSIEAAYRKGGLPAGSVALGALLRSRPREGRETIGAVTEGYRQKRLASQPREPSAGCIFKNPEGNSAGKLIDECGLKGAREGGALVSPVHANFIVNAGDATASDIVALIRRVRAVVRERKGVELEPEAILFGKDWRSVL